MSGMKVVLDAGRERGDPATGRWRHLLVLALCCLPGLAQPAHAAELREIAGAADAPPLELEAWRGGRRSLADFGGRVVLVNFWASWCMPCIQEIPELMKLADATEGLPFSILAVNVGEDRRRMPGFVPKMDRKMLVLLDSDSGAFKRWSGRGLPSSYLVGRDGRIRYEAYGLVDWDRPDNVGLIEGLAAEPARPPGADKITEMQTELIQGDRTW